MVSGLPNSSTWTSRGLDVDVLDLTEDHAQGRVVPQHVADGGRDLTLREDAGGHLVEQRLEQVVVGPVDEGDPHGRALEGAGGEQAAEAAPDDDDVVPRSPSRWRSQQPVHDGLHVVRQRQVPHLLGGEPPDGVRRAVGLGPQRPRPGAPPGR